MNTWSEISRAGKARRSSIFWLDRTMREERTKRPENIRPKMDVGERAKLFAPYAALGRMDTVLKHVEEEQTTGELTHEAILDDLSMEEIDLLMSETISGEEDGLQNE